MGDRAGDWWANKAAPGGGILTTATHINTTAGQQPQQASVYFASVPLEPGKAVRYVILPPDVSQAGAAGHTPSFTSSQWPSAERRIEFGESEGPSVGRVRR